MSSLLEMCLDLEVEAEEVIDFALQSRPDRVICSKRPVFIAWSLPLAARTPPRRPNIRFLLLVRGLMDLPWEKTSQQQP